VGFGFRRSMYFAHVVVLAYIAYSAWIGIVEPARAHWVERFTIAVRVAQPLPLEVEPPHADLGADGCLALDDRRLPVLLTIEVVLERLPRAFRKRAACLELGAAPCWLALVDCGEVRGADRLRREGCDAE